MSLITWCSLEVHLVQRLLHALHMRRGGLNQALPMAEQRSQAADALRRAKRGGEQAEPRAATAAIGNRRCRLPARHVLHVARVDEAHLEPARLEHLVERDPEHAGRLHRDRSTPQASSQSASA